MQYDVQVNGRLRQVVVTRRDGLFVCAVDGREWVVDAARVGRHVLSLLMSNGNGGAVASREVSLAVDAVAGGVVVGIGSLPVPAALQTRRKWGSKSDGLAGGTGPQRIVAPMPGKIVRVLARPGDPVQPRQSVVVVEAMKMENELRASRDGVVTEVLVKEGQSVEAGALLAIVSAS